MDKKAKASSNAKYRERNREFCNASSLACYHKKKDYYQKQNKINYAKRTIKALHKIIDEGGLSERELLLKTRCLERNEKRLQVLVS